MRTSLYVFLLLSVAMPINAFGAPDAEMEQELPEVDIVETVPEQPRLPMIEIEKRAPITHIDIDTDKLRPAPRYDNGNQNLEQDSGVETSEATPRKNKKNSDKDLTELQKNVEDARANETSLKNKTIDAVGIGGVGIGGMMIGEALSEQKADSDIENEMRAYVNTFRCEYGNNPAVRGGTTNVELPGGNELFNLYAQYATLSNDLKIRKTALGIKPGIESEVVLDKSETGLYDDVGTGIVAGSYVSVARALLLGGADAAAWANQKQATTDKLNTGIAVAGVAAIGSALANVANNGSRNKNETIKPLQELEQEINNLPQQTTVCPKGATGTYPNCICSHEHDYFNDKTGQCEQCSGGRVHDASGKDCECQNENYGWVASLEQCMPINGNQNEMCSFDGIDKGNPFLSIDIRNNCKPTCINNFEPSTDENGLQTCVCNEPKTVINGVCQDKPQEALIPIPQPVIGEANLDSGAMFIVNTAKFVDGAETKLINFIKEIEESDTYVKCIISDIEGYTDPLGTEKRNQDLSEERATAVYNLIKNEISRNNDSKFSFVDNFEPIGNGEYQCSCLADYLTGPGNEACYNKRVGHVLYGNTNYPPCRRVKMVLACQMIISNGNDGLTPSTTNIKSTDSSSIYQDLFNSIPNAE